MSVRPAALDGEGRAAWTVALLVVLAGCLCVAVEARHLTFNADDWQFVLQRRGVSADVFLQPHLQHLSALPILAYKGLLQVFGAGSYAPFMALLILVHGVACALLYVLARRRVGPWAALAPTAVLVVLGPAWNDLLWAFQVGFIGSVAAGLGAVLCLERRDPRGDAVGAALLVVALLCSSVGLGMLVLAAVLLALEPPRVWRRLWVVGVPLALYVAWYAAYGVSDANSHNIHRVPSYLANALFAAVTSVTGVGHAHVTFVSTSTGRFIAVAAVALLVLHIVRGGRVPALAWASLAAAVALWTAAALSYFPSREAEQSRYQYAAAVLLLLALVSIAEGWRPTRRSGVVLGVVTLLVVGANTAMLVDRAGYWRENSAFTAAEAGALEVARGVVAPSFAPGDLFTFAATHHNGLESVTAGRYFSGAAAFGSIADDPEAIRRRPEKVREGADLVLGNAERLTLQPVRAWPPHLTCRSGPTGAALGEVAAGPGLLGVRVAPGTPAELQLRRFADRYRFLSRGGNLVPSVSRRLGAPRVPQLVDGAPMIVDLPRDRSALAWHVRVTGGRDVRLCLAG